MSTSVARNLARDYVCRSGCGNNGQPQQSHNVRISTAVHNRPGPLQSIRGLLEGPSECSHVLTLFRSGPVISGGSEGGEPDWPELITSTRYVSQRECGNKCLTPRIHA